MDNERLLSYTLSQKLTETDLAHISGTGSGCSSHTSTFNGADTIDDSWHDVRE